MYIHGYPTRLYDPQVIIAMEKEYLCDGVTFTYYSGVTISYVAHPYISA